MPVLSWAPRWPLAAASRREITEAALTSLSAHATVMPSPSPPPSPDPFPSAQLPFYPPTTNPPSVQTLTDLSDDGFIGSQSSLQTHTGLFALPHPVLSSLLETCTTRKISTPPFHCRTVSPFAIPQPSLSLPHPGLCFCLPHQRRTRGHRATGMEYKCSQLRGSMGNQSSKDSSIHFMNSSSVSDTYSNI